MKKKLFQALSLLFALTLMCSALSPVALAAENQVPSIDLMYTHADKVSVVLHINQGTASCKGKVIPASANYTASASLTLKRKSGSIWINVATWSATGTRGLGVSFSKTKALSVKGDYKLTLSVKIKDSSGAVLETIHKSSTIQTY